MTTKKKSGKALATLPVAERAVVALGMREREQELIQLAASTETITAITNPDGYKQVRAARIALKNERLAIQKTGKDARDDATKFSKAVIAEENRLIALIEPEEKRLGILQDEEDARLERERQAEIDREVERQAKLQERIAELRGNQMLLPTSGADLIAEHIRDLEAIAVDESFEEFSEQAQDAKAQGLARLRALHTAAIAHEVEQKKIAEDRAELARLKVEAAERERKDKIARDAEAARVRVEETAAQVERDRIAAEERRVAAEQAELARQQEDLLKPQAPTVTPADPPTLITRDPNTGYGVAIEVLGPDVYVTVAARKPSREAIINALRNTFGLDERQVIAILSEIDWQEALTELAA